MAKFITAQEAAKLIPDSATVGLAGMGLSGWPEEVACAIRDSFKETGHPCDLNLKQGSAMGDWGYGNGFVGWERNPRKDGPDQEHGARGVTRFGEAGPGLVTRWSAAHIGSAFALTKLVQQNQLQCHCLPQGVIVNLWREIAAGRPGLLTKVGLGTFVDPRIEGGKMNAVTTDELVELVEFQGRSTCSTRASPSMWPCSGAPPPTKTATSPSSMRASSTRACPWPWRQRTAAASSLSRWSMSPKAA